MVLSTRRGARRNTVPKEHTQQLIDAPLDVLIEIFLFLEPLDLLHLARTTKPLRQFLLNPTKSSALWKNVIGNVEGFPPCPDYMSAPAYTHLAFVPVCHRCFSPCETVEWELRMRCCPDCFPKMTMKIHYSPTPSNINYGTNLKLPLSSARYKLDYDHGLNVTVSLETTINPSCSLLDWKVARSRKRPRNVLPEEFEARRDELLQSIRMHARSCRDWELTRLKEKAAQLSLVRRQRVKDIENKLKELGWTDVLSYADYNRRLLRLPEVRKPDPLTPTEWDRIRPQLISWAQKARKEMAWNHCIATVSSVSQIVQQELRDDTSLKVHPRKVDIIMLPAIQSVLESAIHSDTSHDSLEKKFLRVLPPAIRKWSSGAVEELEQLAREQLCLSPLSKPCRLPWVIFRCKACPRNHSQRLRFDEALTHHHLYKETRGGDEGETGEMFAYGKSVTEFNAHLRNIRPLGIDATVSRRVENLVKRMGQNPSRVTYDDLCRSTVRVVCGLCDPQAATQMSFACAFRHCLDTHPRNREIEVWTRAPARDQNAANSRHR